MSMIEKGEIEGYDDTKKEWHYTLKHGFSELRKEDLTEVDHVCEKFEKLLFQENKPPEASLENTTNNVS